MAKVGRPSKYDPAYCDKAREFLREGYSVLALAGEIGVALTTIYNWMDQHPDFLVAVKEGQAAAARWWEDRLRDIVKEGGGNATAAIFGLKNRGADVWRDRTETEVSGSLQVEAVKVQFVRPDPKPADR